MIAASPRALTTEITVCAEFLDAVGPPVDGDGIVLGAGPGGEPVSVGLLRPQPTRLIVVGGLYLARQVALRALASGARLVVGTGRPAAWQPLARAAHQGPDHPAGPEGLVQVRGLTPMELPPASPDMPLLVVHDDGAVPRELFPPRSPWHTTLDLLPHLDPQIVDPANDADLVLLRRLPVGQAELAARIWRLSPPMTSELSSLRDDGVVVLGTNLWIPLRLVTTPREQQILGPVRRGD